MFIRCSSYLRPLRAFGIRDILHAFVLLGLIALASCTNPVEPGGRVGDDGTGGGGSRPVQLQAIGCFLQGASASASSLNQMAASGRLFWPSGNFQLDSFYQQEGLNLVGTFGLSPRAFYLVDSDGPNAYATSEVVNPLGPDGTILFGQSLLQQQLQKDGSGATVVAILAHEFGHLAQFRGGFRETGKRPELHADFMSGWYLNLRGRYAWTNLMPALRVFYDIGDYQFNSPNHHGTPQERLGAAQAGFSSGAFTAQQAYSLGLQYVSRLN